MLRLLLPAVFLGLMTSLVFGVSLEELNQRYKPLPTEDDMRKQRAGQRGAMHGKMQGHSLRNI